MRFPNFFGITWSVQKKFGDFIKFSGLLRIYYLYKLCPMWLSSRAAKRVHTLGARAAAQCSS